MFRIGLILIIFLASNLIEKKTKQKVKKNNLPSYDEVANKETDYGKMKEKIKKHAESGFDSFKDIMDELDGDNSRKSRMSSSESEMKILEAELNRKMAKIDRFQRDLEDREGRIRIKEIEVAKKLEQEKYSNINSVKDDIVNGIVFSEILNKPKFQQRR